jgi:hypothetical protein
MIDQRKQRSRDEDILPAENPSCPGCCIGSEKGVVLVVVLVLSAVALAIMTALIYMITIGTQTSGLQKRYKTALEAGIGGGNVFCQLISARGDTSLIGTAKLSNFIIKTPAACKDTDTGVNIGINAKLLSPSSAWNASCSNSLSIDPTDATSYDAQVDLGTYRVYAKIVATTPGNTVTDTGLLNSSVATSNTGLVAVTPISYLYAVEVVSQNIAKEDERAKISFLYQF